MIEEKDIKVGLKFKYKTVSLTGEQNSSYITNKSGDDIIFEVTRIICSDGSVLRAWCDKDIAGIKHGGFNEFGVTDIMAFGEAIEQEEYIEGKIALRYFNEQRAKAISNEGTRRFETITNKMLDTYKAKNHDYGNAFSDMYDELGIDYGYGKIREKVNRIKVLKDNDAQVSNEPLEDALLDCANYCILTLMEYQKRKENGKD